MDREERLDVDEVYMAYVQATTGKGGWPMNVWLTPDLKPFVGGTYYPPKQFQTISEKIAAAWQSDREKIKTSSESALNQLRQLAASAQPASGALEKALLDKTYEQIKSSYDPRFGGFGDAPKFPRPVALNFLLRYHARTGTQAALDMALFTLRKMVDGGIHDQIGGGFHRYSIDARWHVPHFEKMIYDQAQLACVYLDACQITQDRFYADTAKDILAYVQRNLTGERGQFFSAEDADSALRENPSVHAEGAFYAWEEREIIQTLGQPQAGIFNYHHGVEAGGNVEDDPRGEWTGKNILKIAHPVEDTAEKFGQSSAEIEKLINGARQKLAAARSKNPRPHLDDKTITAWNGLMISAFARAYQVLNDPQYLSAATRAAQFIRANLYEAKSGRLLRRYRAGESAIDMVLLATTLFSFKDCSIFTKLQPMSVT